jgi:signal transduction histidine kinase
MAEGLGDILRYVDAGDARSLKGRLSPQEAEIVETINQKVAGRASLEDLLSFIFNSTRGISPCDRIGLALLEDDGSRIVAHHAVAAYEPLLLREGYAEDVDGSSLQTVLEKRMPRIISDLEAYLAARPASLSARLLVREGVRSNMTCPLLVEGRVVGVLFRSSRRVRAYDDRQVLLHEAVSERLSQAVEKTLQIERLAAANRDYFGMLAFVTHELKSPVASLIMDAAMLRDGYLGELQPKQRERVERLLGKGRYLLGLVQEYLDLARVESGALRAAVEEVEFLTDVVEPAVEVVMPQIEAKEMRLAVLAPDPPMRARLDPSLMKIVVVNLLTNAAKYGRGGGEIRLRVLSEMHRLQTAVWNEGPGFSESECGRLFRKFSRLRSPALMKEKGTGIGLYTCRRIVQAHGGRIRAASQEGSWAEFTVEIPQPPAAPTAQETGEGTSEGTSPGGVSA